MGWIVRRMAKRGFINGNGVFAAISSAIAFIRLLQKFTGGAPKTLYKAKLEPGQVLIISDALPKKPKK